MKNKWMQLIIAVVLGLLVSPIIYHFLTYLFLQKFFVYFVIVGMYVIYFLLQILLQQVTKFEINFSFVVYLSVIFIALFMKSFANPDIILDPLSFLHLSQVTPLQTILNIILMIPLGVYKHHYHISILFIITLFVLLESAQFIFNVGTFDFGDIFLYFIGVIIGLLLVLIYQKILKMQKN